MAIRSLSPYVNFAGTAARAIALYERVLGAVKVSVTRAGDVPGMKVPASGKDRILHAVLALGGAQLMLSDASGAVPAGGNVHVSLDFSDPQEMSEKFAALAEGGSVTVPLQETFWGAKFGMVTDPFGVRWMLNCAGAQA